MTTTRIPVVGMTCDHCRKAVTEELSAVPGAQSVVVDLADGSATVEHDAGFDLAAARGAIVAAGYTVGS